MPVLARPLTGLQPSAGSPGASIAVAGGSTVVAALAVTGSVSPAACSLPGEGRLAAAFGIAVIVSLAWGAVGWTGTVLKSAAVAIAVMLLWTTIVQVQVDYFATVMPKLRVPSTTC